MNLINLLTQQENIKKNCIVALLLKIIFDQHKYDFVVFLILKYNISIISAYLHKKNKTIEYRVFSVILCEI